ncbi:ubiquitin-like small modifier protein 2 [Haloplanus sp. GCM10025708]|uniref:ubiquitin-like small modifier protein SAMP2 n=1 Tax=Haloferacaceae TaxID=1644056 RepID=UPI00360B14B8
MQVTTEVVGDAVHEVSLRDDATYADLLAELGYSPHEVAVLVDGSPVPEDGTVTGDRVRVLRLIKGGGA